MVHTDMTANDRYEIIVYYNLPGGYPAESYYYTDSKDEACRHAALLGDCTVIDMVTGETKIWL